MTATWRAGLLLAALAAAGHAGAQESALTFVGVALDADTSRADEKLRDFLRARLGVKFENRELEYGRAVDTLVHWDAETQGPLVARVTPYVYVVAEMLGANLEILGTYVSRRTRDTTYNSYLVLRRDAGLATTDLDDFVRFLRERPAPARFIYHNKFSSSSYLLPSLYFRRVGIFAGGTANAADQKHVFIRAEKPAGAESSTDLVRMVKQRRAEFAAVWDGTQSRFATDPELMFLKLSNNLPNDLLVYSPLPERALRDRIVASLRSMKDTEVNSGDFLRWVDFNAAPEARRALSRLRWLTKAAPAPVPIKIRSTHQDGTAVESALLEAAKQAVGLSGTEFVLFDEDYHKQFDVLWTLRKSHDDSLVITSEYPDFKLPPQQFHLSFKRGDRESLVARIEEQISNGMHRVREVWPFDDETPTVLRDVRFSLPAGSRLKAVRITWNDFTNNDRVVGTPFDVTVAAGDFHAFKLKGDGFPRRSDGTRYDFDPLSITSHRVLLVRPAADSRLFRVGTYALVGLFVASAGLGLWSLWRERAAGEAGGAG